MANPKSVCIAGASGLVGANITKAALAGGYAVKGTLRNPQDPDKAPYLFGLPGGEERLTLHQAEMASPGDFDEAMAGTDCVFIASLIPTYFGADGTPARELDDARGYEEIVRPTLDGCMNILHSARAAGVRNVVICSSTSSTNPVPPVPCKTEDDWSDEQEQYRAKKYTSAAKTVMEKAALQFAAENDIRLCILLPTIMLGPALLPIHAQQGFLARLRGMLAGEPPQTERIPNGSISMIHLEDLAALFMAAYENPSAQGRYFGVYESWHWQDLYKELKKLIPEMQMPAPLEEPPEPPTTFNFTRRDSLGVALRDIPTLLRDTVDWLRANPA